MCLMTEKTFSINMQTEAFSHAVIQKESEPKRRANERANEKNPKKPIQTGDKQPNKFYVI